MYHEMPRGASFWLLLCSIDQDLAETTRKQACPCGGRLHRADYPRKPRGGPDNLSEQYRWRFSFCCEREGCRKRVTPPSVRFLGPKVYLNAVVVLVAALRQGPSPRRVRQLSKHFGADRRTIARWQILWREHVPHTHRSGRWHAVVCRHLGKLSFFRCRSSKHSCEATIPAGSGGACCDFCRR